MKQFDCTQLKDTVNATCDKQPQTMNKDPEEANGTKYCCWHSLNPYVPVLIRYTVILNT